MSASGISGHSSIDYEPEHVTEKTIIIQDYGDVNPDQNFAEQTIDFQLDSHQNTKNSNVWSAERTATTWIVVLSIILAALVIIVALIIISLVTKKPISVCCSTVSE